MGGNWVFAHCRAVLEFRTLVDCWIVVGLGVASVPWGHDSQEFAIIA